MPLALEISKVAERALGRVLLRVSQRNITSRIKRDLLEGISSCNNEADQSQELEGESASYRPRRADGVGPAWRSAG